MDPFELNNTKIDIVLADLDLALSMVEIARTSANPEVRKRDCANGRRAYFQIRDELLPLCSPDDAQRSEIDRKLSELRRQLQALGEKFT
jgi:hypothetical protein